MLDLLHDVADKYFPIDKKDEKDEEKGGGDHEDLESEILDLQSQKSRRFFAFVYFQYTRMNLLVF